MQMALRVAARQHWSNVLMLVLEAPAVLLLIGSIPRASAGYTSGIQDVIKIMMSHTLNSSHTVVVRNVITLVGELTLVPVHPLWD